MGRANAASVVAARAVAFLKCFVWIVEDCTLKAQIIKTVAEPHKLCSNTIASMLEDKIVYLKVAVFEILVELDKVSFYLFIELSDVMKNKYVCDVKST